MGTQLCLPLGRPIAPASIPTAVQQAGDAAREVVITEAADEGPAVEGDVFERLHDELEGVLRRLQDTMAHGPEFTKAWAKARVDTCESYGWTEEAFYTELQERLLAKRAGST